MRVKKENTQLEQLALKARLEQMGFKVTKTGTITGAKGADQIGLDQAAKMAGKNEVWASWIKSNEGIENDATEAVESLAMTILGFGKSLKATLEKLDQRKGFDDVGFARVTRRGQDAAEKLEQLAGGKVIIAAADPKVIRKLLKNLQTVSNDTAEFVIQTSMRRVDYVQSKAQTETADAIFESLDAGAEAAQALQKIMDRVTKAPK